MIAAGGVAGLGLPVAGALASRRRFLASDPRYLEALRSAAPDALLTRIYAPRNQAPLWLDEDLRLTPAGRLAARAVDAAGRHRLGGDWETGATPALYTPQTLSAAQAGDLEARLSTTFARFVERLHTPAPRNALFSSFPDRTPDRRDASNALATIAAAAQPLGAVADLLHMHPLYQMLVDRLPPPAIGSTDTDLGNGCGGIAFEGAAATNLDRLRGLPVDAPRHIVVNVASATLDVYEGTVPVRTMRVVVGRPATPTPLMSGALAYAVLNPYWNIPQDLLRDRIAPAVLRQGVEAFHARRLEALADWSADAALLPPETIDWAAVASGLVRVRVRQRPGPDNMMGRVKFMLPNDLGIYLHDTPDRRDFDRPDRALSAGCVRVEDPDWLFRWLFGEDIAARANSAPEQTVALEGSVPVFLTYQTLAPAAGGALRTWPDLYGRDA